MSKKGFTLIELLIVITIIGVLAVALLPRIVGIPARGRDTARIAALNQIVTALQTYYNDKGQFPTTTTNCVPDTIKGYLGGSVPVDPSGKTITGCATAGSYYYKPLSVSGTANQAFVLAADTEVDGSGAGYYKLSVVNDPSLIAYNAGSPPATITDSDLSSTDSQAGNNLYAIIR